jgi:hypothetical protein
MTDISAFQNAFHVAGLSTNMRRRLGSLSPGWTPWITLNAPPGKFVLACVLGADVALTDTGANNAVAGADLLYEWIDGYQVAPREGTTARTEVVTTSGCEEVERVCFDTAVGWTSGDIAAVSGHLGSYARAVPGNFGSTTTRTDTSELWVPVGGQSAAIKFHIPSITASFAAGVTATYTVSWGEVYSLYAGVVAAIETVTASLAVGNQDFQQFVPKGMAVDFFSILGVEANTDMSEISMTDNTGASIINMDTGPTTGEMIAASAYVYPRFATNTPSYDSLLFYFHKTYPVTLKCKVLVAQTFDLVFVAFSGGTVAPAPDPSPTPSPALVKQTGVSVTGIGPTPMKPA